MMNQTLINEANNEQINLQPYLHWRLRTTWFKHQLIFIHLFNLFNHKTLRTIFIRKKDDLQDVTDIFRQTG